MIKRNVILVLISVLMLMTVSCAIPEAMPERAEKKTDTVDYSNEGNWAYFGVGEDKEADLFIICPTVDMNDEYNMSLNDEKTKEKFLGALNMERGIYENSTCMYAPYYRQAAMKVYGLDSEEREPYLPEGCYHIYDYQFFFRNLQENVDERVRTYMELYVKQR